MENLTREQVIETVKATPYTYEKLPEGQRKDPEILRIAIIYGYEKYECFDPLCYALPEAITNDIIDWLISNNIYPETPNLLSNKYYVLCVLEKKPEIAYKVSEELQKNPEIQRLSLIFNPSFLETVGSVSIEQYLSDYGNKYNIPDYGIKDVLSDDMFIKRVLTMTPKVYLLLFDFQKKDKTNIQTILDVDGCNIELVPHRYLTADLINLSKQSYEMVFELLDDSTKTLEFLNIMNSSNNMTTYITNIFLLDSNLLDKFIKVLKNNDAVIEKVVDLIGDGNNYFYFSIHMLMIRNKDVKEFFEDFIVKNILIKGVNTEKKDASTQGYWSPVSSAGKRYKFARGVVGIDENGKKYEVNIDKTEKFYGFYYGHGEGTIEIAERAGCSININNLEATPYELALEVANQGLIVMHFEGTAMWLYLSQSISLEQYESLKSELAPREGFSNIAFMHNNKPHDEFFLTVGMIEKYCNYKVLRVNELGKSNTQ